MQLDSYMWLERNFFIHFFFSFFISIALCVRAVSVLCIRTPDRAFDSIDI